MKGIIEGETRVIVSGMSMDEIFKERKMFKEKVIANVQGELSQFGLKMYALALHIHPRVGANEKTDTTQTSRSSTTPQAANTLPSSRERLTRARSTKPRLMSPRLACAVRLVRRRSKV